MSTVIVFDLSEVLISGLMGVEFVLAAELGLPAADVKAPFAGPHQHRFFCGEMTEDEYLDEVIRQLPVLSRDRVRQAVRENFQRLVPGTRELAEELSRTHRVVLLSDHGREWVAHILEIHPWLGSWPERHFSYERRVTKGHIDAFHSLAVALGMPPESCLLIDDSPANVALARQAGWQSIQFASVEQVSRELQQRGLLAGVPVDTALPLSPSSSASDPRWERRPQRVVVAGFIHQSGQVLLARRSTTKAIAPGKYHLPGGHVEFGEQPTATLARELREELSIEVQVADVVSVFSYLWDDVHTIGMVYRAEFTGHRDEIRWDPDDLAGVRWVTESELENYLSPDDHNFQAAVAGFEMLRGRDPSCR